MGKYPRETEDTLVPYHWIEMAEERYKKLLMNKKKLKEMIIFLFVWVLILQGWVGMQRFYVREKIIMFPDISRNIITRPDGYFGKNWFKNKSINDYALIDTIGEGAVCIQEAGN